MDCSAATHDQPVTTTGRSESPSYHHQDQQHHRPPPLSSSSSSTSSLYSSPPAVSALDISWNTSVSHNNASPPYAVWLTDPCKACAGATAGQPSSSSCCSTTRPPTTALHGPAQRVPGQSSRDPSPLTRPISHKQQRHQTRLHHHLPPLPYPVRPPLSYPCPTHRVVLMLLCRAWRRSGRRTRTAPPGGRACRWSRATRRRGSTSCTCSSSRHRSVRCSVRWRSAMRRASRSKSTTAPDDVACHILLGRLSSCPTSSRSPASLTSQCPRYRQGEAIFRLARTTIRLTFRMHGTALGGRKGHPDRVVDCEGAAALPAEPEH